MLKQLMTASLGLAAALLVVGARAHASHEDARTAAPPQVTVIKEDSSALREVLVHYVPEQEELFHDTYRDFLGTLPPSVHLVAVHPVGARSKLDAFLSSIDPSLPGRTQAVEVKTPLGIWSKDRALVLTGDAPLTTFLIPPKPKFGESGRPFDWDIVPAVAAAVPDRFRTRELPIAFDAGDFAVSGKRVLFDANLWSRNRSRGYPSAAAFKSKMAQLMGRDVVMLGASDGDVPRHHMSMYMAPLDGNVVLVGDPRAGLQLTGPDFKPGEKSLETEQPLAADTSPETIARFDRAAHDLELAGFKVVRIPTVAFDDKTYFAYTNGIYETRGSGADKKKIAWVPSFASGDDPLVADLDTAARTVYERLGYEVRPVTVRRLYPSHGTIGCVVNVLARD